MSDFNSEHYKVFFSKIKDAKFLKINSSSQQDEALRNIKKYGSNDPFISIYISEIAEKFLLGRSIVTKDLIYDLASTATFHMHCGNTDEVYRILAEKHMKK